MGGKDSGVTEATRSIFLESAFFATNAISGRARALGLQSDSSYRFERGVDPALQVIALQRATRLLLGIVGGRAGPVEEKSSARYLPRRTPIRLRLERVARLLGTGLSGQGIVKILKRLGMSVTGKGPVWKVVPPGYRFDIEREEDLIEEIARVHGYTNLPSRLPRMTMTPYAAPEGRLDESRLRHLLVDRDYQEVITYSFVDPAMNQLVDPGSATAVLANPIAADMAVMRTNLWPGLLSVLRHNLNRQQTRVRLFEIGRCFTNAGKAAYRQDKRLGGLVYGSEHAEQWGIPRRPVDYFAAKSDVMALLELTGIPDGFRFQPSNHPALHPGQSAEILASGKHVGLLGLLHPEIRSKLGLEQNTLVFELDIALFASGRVPNFSELSKFPSIRRDLAFIIDENISADRVTTTIKSAVGSLLIDLELFDEYRGKGIDSGRKSLALALTFQHSSRTLKEDEVETEIAKIIRALESQFNAQLRN
jgi:phenylalanyl-tRNA synthetase beta chain